VANTVSNEITLEFDVETIAEINRYGLIARQSRYINELETALKYFATHCHANSCARTVPCDCLYAGIARRVLRK
jgi:hypothetical protein